MSEFPDVPCNGCMLCCHGDAIRILPHEDASRWQTVPHDHYPGHRMLAHKANGDCVYLVAGGCSIQDTKPQMCKEMDCRRLAQAFTWTQARKIQGFPIRIWHRGKELLRDGKAA